MLVGEFCLINVRRINPQGKEDKQMVMPTMVPVN